MVNNKIFDLRPVSELFAIVKNDFRQLDDEGLVDEGTLIKVVMACNDKLGIPIREIKQVCFEVENYKAKLPANFEKLYYAAAVTATNGIVHKMVNPFDNKFDRDVLYEAELDRDSLGGTDHYNVTIKKKGNVQVYNSGGFIKLDVDPRSKDSCHISCPNLKKQGRYTIEIRDGYIITPFRSGEIYMMYLATMCDDEGNLLYPFHPLITPYYEWALKEKIIMDAVFNSDGDYSGKLKLAQSERLKAWLDAFNITTDKGYGEYVEYQRRKELSWYNQYFKYFQ